MPKLLVLENDTFKPGAAHMLRLAELAPRLEVELLHEKNLRPELLAQVEILFGFPGRDMLAQAARLRWLHLPSAGADAYMDLSLYARHDIIVTNSSGVYGAPVAEHALAMFLSLARAIPQQTGRESDLDARSVAEREAVLLSQSTVLIVGMGDIGTTLARLLRAFDCRILGVRRNILHRPDGVDGIYTAAQLPELLPQADFVALCLPRTPETAVLMNREMLTLCKPGSILVNVGRGDAVDMEALTDMLVGGRLRGAGLDVTNPEPLPAEHPLRGLRNVILTPHTAGLSPLRATRVLSLFGDLLERYESGRRLYNQVDFLRGY